MKRRQVLILVLGISGLPTALSTFAKEPVSAYPTGWNSSGGTGPILPAARVPSLFGPAIDRWRNGKNRVILTTAGEEREDRTGSTTAASVADRPSNNPATNSVQSISSTPERTPTESGCCPAWTGGASRPLLTGHAAGKVWHWLTYHPGPAVIPKCLTTPYPGYFLASFPCSASHGYLPVPSNLSVSGKCGIAGSADPLASRRRLPGGPVLLPVAGTPSMVDLPSDQQRSSPATPPQKPMKSSAAGPTLLPVPKNLPTPPPAALSKPATGTPTVYAPRGMTAPGSLDSQYSNRRALTAMYQPVGLPTAEEPRWIESVLNWWRNLLSFESLRQYFHVVPMEPPLYPLSATSSMPAGMERFSRTPRPAGEMPVSTSSPNRWNRSSSRSEFKSAGTGTSEWRVLRPDQPFTNP